MRRLSTNNIHAKGFDIEFDVELTNTTEYHKIINELRNKFSTIREIKSIRAIEYDLTEQYLE